MLKFLSFLQGGQRTEIKDARQIYQEIMTQSRKPVFYGPKRFADSYDGRMEVLCMHLSILLHALRRYDVNGERLSQAIYDVMIDDFDTALREEGLSDTGVSRRIKPLAKMFFSRAKTYAEVLQNDRVDTKAFGDLLKNYISLSYGKENTPKISEHKKLAIYAKEYHKELANADFKNIVQTKLGFPELS